MRKIIPTLFAGACALLAAALPASPAQNNLWSPTTGTVTGLQLTTNYNSAFSAIASCNSGATAPANDVSAAAVRGQCWLDTSTTPNPVRQYSGTAWLIIGWLDQTNGFWILNEAGGVGTVTAAATTDLCASVNSVQSITGNTGITSFGSNCIVGTRKFLNFTGTPTITHNATSMILPNAGSNITAAVGDTAVVEQISAGNWRVISYQKADGTSLSTSANFSANVAFSGTISATLAAGNNNDWSPAGFATAENIRTTPNASGSTITGIANGGTGGKQITILNVGAANITLTANDTNSTTAGDRFQIPAPYVIGPDQSVQLRYDGSTSRWRIANPQRPQPSAVAFKNLKLVTTATVGGATSTTITADELTAEDANGNVVRLSSVSLTPAVTSSGANGLDTGTVSSGAITWYSVIVIFNPTANTVAGLYSLQTNCLSATLPSGYTYCARVGWVPTDAASPGKFRGVTQYGRRAGYVQVSGTNTAAAPTIVSGTNGSTFTSANNVTPSNAAISNFVPTATAASIIVWANNATNSGTSGNLAVAPQNSAAYTGAGNGPRGANLVTWPVWVPGGGAGAALAEMPIESTNLGYVADSGACALFAYGWIDNL